MIDREWLKETLLVNRFGGAGALVRHMAARASASAGLFRSLEKIEWTRVERVVFVCTGNICRSPYAELRARDSRLLAVSFGLDTTPGSPAATSAVSNATKRGVDLTRHRSQLFDGHFLMSGDLVIGFEPWHVRSVRRFATQGSVQFTLAGLWSRPLRPDICDPLGRSDAYFQICFDLIDSCVEQLRARIGQSSSREGLTGQKLGEFRTPP